MFTYYLTMSRLELIFRKERLETMQNIPYATIGTTLQLIWTGNPHSAPPIHVWTEGHPEGRLFLGLMHYQQHVDPERQTPSAVFVIASNTQTGGGPYFLYWIEDDVSGFKAVVDGWLKAFSNRTAEKIQTMGIGNSFL